MKGYRKGGCHKVTIIEFDEKHTPGKDGRRSSDRLVGMTRTEEDADLPIRALTHWRKFEEES